MSYRYPKTAPQPVEGQVGLGEGEVNRSYSAPVQKPPHDDDDSSSDEQSDDSISMASAGDMGPTSPTGSIQGEKGLQLPTETMNPLDFMGDEKGGNSTNPRSGSQPPIAPRPTSQGRPGSNRHKVLPPISPILKDSYMPEY